MSGDLYTLDTNILFYAMDRDAGIKHTLAAQIIEDAVSSPCILTLQSLGEFYWSVTRQEKLTHLMAQEQIRDWSILFPVYVASQTTLNKAIHGVHEHGFSFWDAMVWACAKRLDVAVSLQKIFRMGGGWKVSGLRIHSA